MLAFCFKTSCETVQYYCVNHPRGGHYTVKLNTTCEKEFATPILHAMDKLKIYVHFLAFFTCNLFARGCSTLQWSDLPVKSSAIKKDFEDAKKGFNADVRRLL
jgi:hypothetical protein